MPYTGGAYQSLWVKYTNSGTPIWGVGTSSGNTNLYNITTDPSGNLIVRLPALPISMRNTISITPPKQYLYWKTTF